MVSSLLVNRTLVYKFVLITACRGSDTPALSLPRYVPLCLQGRI